MRTVKRPVEPPVMPALGNEGLAVNEARTRFGTLVDGKRQAAAPLSGATGQREVHGQRPRTTDSLSRLRRRGKAKETAGRKRAADGAAITSRWARWRRSDGSNLFNLRRQKALRHNALVQRRRAWLGRSDANLQASSGTPR